MRYALIDANNVVVNLVLWDGVAAYDPAGLTPVQSGTANIGDVYADGAFTPPESA